MGSWEDFYVIGTTATGKYFLYCKHTYEIETEVGCWRQTGGIYVDSFEEIIRIARGIAARKTREINDILLKDSE